MTVGFQEDPTSARILPATPRAIVVDLLAGAVVKLVTEGREPTSRDLAGHSAEPIP